MTVERYESDLETSCGGCFPLCANDRLEGEEDPADPELWYRCFIQQLLSHGVLSPRPPPATTPEGSRISPPTCSPCAGCAGWRRR